MASIHSTLGHLYSNSRDHQRLGMAHINFDIYNAINFRYIFLCLPEGQTFWSEGSAYTKTFSKVKRQLFKVEDCGNPKVDDEGNKDPQWLSLIHI